MGSSSDMVGVLQQLRGGGGSRLGAGDEDFGSCGSRGVVLAVWVV